MKPSVTKIDKAVGLLIKTARQKKGLSQIELADKMGLDNFRNIQEWESGSRSLPLHILHHLCTLLDVSEQVLQQTILENTTLNDQS